ncbi:unnamed protein product, partial [marine sediment metagenome]
LKKEASNETHKIGSYISGDYHRFDYSGRHLVYGRPDPTGDHYPVW